MWTPKYTLDQFKKRYVLRSYITLNRNVTHTAVYANVAPKTVRKYIKNHDGEYPPILKNQVKHLRQVSYFYIYKTWKYFNYSWFKTKFFLKTSGNFKRFSDVFEEFNFLDESEKMLILSRRGKGNGRKKLNDDNNRKDA